MRRVFVLSLIARATIIVDVDAPEEVAQAEAWLTKWRPHLQYVSEQQGCGCCIYMWDVEGSDEAISEIPPSSGVDSEWSNPNRRLKR
jgi:hypothetical protein